MNATTGDRIQINGRQVGQPTRLGTIVETRGSGGAPPFLVRWDGAQDAVLVFPGPDARIAPAGAAAPARA
jgi:hypothetical protein